MRTITDKTFAALNAVSATPAHNTLMGQRYASKHTIQAKVTGSPTTATGQLEGSLDGTAWFDLSGAQDVSANVMFHVANKPVRKVRFNLTALSGGSSPTVQAIYTGVAES